MASRILMNEYKTLQKEPWVNIELDNENVMSWNVALIALNPDSLYHGGYFQAKMTFPQNYPYQPPTFRFLRPLFHPNIFPDGRLCISILHAPGEDETSGELASERWSPAQRVESVLISILSLLDDAEVSSPANVDAGKLLRTNPDAFKLRVKHDVDSSKADIPAGFVMPTSAEVVKKREIPDDPDFWYDSGEEDDFGGSDSDDEEMVSEGDFEDDDEEEEETEDEAGDENVDGVEMVEDEDDDNRGKAVKA